MLPSHAFVATKLLELLIVLIVFALFAYDDARRFNRREFVVRRWMDEISRTGRDEPTTRWLEQKQRLANVGDFSLSLGSVNDDYG